MSEQCGTTVALPAEGLVTWKTEGLLGRRKDYLEDGKRDLSEVTVVVDADLWGIGHSIQASEIVFFNKIREIVIGGGLVEGALSSVAN